MSSGDKLASILDRMVVKTDLRYERKKERLRLPSPAALIIQGMTSIAGPTNARKYSVESHDFSTNEFAEVCMLPLCRLQLLSRPHVFAVLDFDQAHVPLVCMELVGLSHAVGRCGPLCRVVSAA
eukprot:509788-Pelagomonas_calceolata.AAC.1